MIELTLLFSSLFLAICYASAANCGGDLTGSRLNSSSQYSDKINSDFDTKNINLDKLELVSTEKIQKILKDRELRNLSKSNNLDSLI